MMTTETRAQRAPGAHDGTSLSPTLLRSALLQVIALTLAFTTLLTAIFLTMTVTLLDGLNRVDRTDRVIARAQLVQKLLLDMETGVRGYLVTGRGDSLGPYTEAKGRIDGALVALGRLVAAEPGQAPRVARIRDLIDRWGRHAGEVIASRRADRSGRRGGELDSRGMALMDDMRARLAACIAEEEARRDVQTRKARSTAIAGLCCAGAAGIVLGGALAIATRRRLARVTRAYEGALATARRQAEALRRSEARFQAFMEHSPAATFIKDDHGRYLYGNPTWVELHGKPFEDLVGADDTTLWDADQASKLAESDRYVMETGRPFEYAAAVRSKGGAYRHWITLKFPLDDGSGLRLVGGIAIEVTDLRRAAEELCASEERYALAVRGSSGGLWDWNCRTDQVYYSSRYNDLLGYADDELEHDLQSTVALLHPDDAERTIAAMSEHLAGRAPYDVEFRLKCKDGTYRWFLGRGQAAWDEHGKARRMVGSISDITARKEAEEENRVLNVQLERRLQRLASLRKIDAAITAGLDMGTTLGVVLEQVTAQLGVDAADVLFLDPSDQALVPAAAAGFRSDAPAAVRIPLCRHGGGRVALERRSVHIADLGRSDESFVRAGMFADEGLVAYHAVPLVAKGQVKGILEVFHRSTLEHDRDWVDFLETLASQAAVAVENVSLYDGLRRANAELTLAYDATIEGWSRALDLRDKETEGHSQRVTEMTVRLARAIGVGASEIVQIRRGALLHDIGKMGVPDRILLKPGPLVDEEWQVMRQHPAYAREMLSPVEFLRPALDIPYCHHEKWDGTGYPRGLAGEAIPLAARIFSVADIWDALSHDRPYRKAWPPGRVIDYVASLAGTALDPRLVETFLRLHSAGLLGDLIPSGADPSIAAGPEGSPAAAVADALPAGYPAAQPAPAASPAAVPTEAGEGREALRVLVADGDGAAAGQLKQMVEAMGHEAIVATDGTDALQVIRRGGVQAAIVDWRLPPVDGPDLCRQIHAEADIGGVYVILAGPRQGGGADDLPLDADDFLAKPTDPRDLAARLAVARRLISVQELLLERSTQAERMYVELRHQNERLAELVATDPLTGLSNRRHLLEVLEAQAALTDRQDRPLSVAILDVDRFKQYNDVYGHRAGDEVLCRIADILRSNVRACDVVARYGGEEFVIVMPMTDELSSRDVAERLRAAIADFSWPLRPITASLGVATLQPGSADTARLVEAADQALYRAKQRGRDRVCHDCELRVGSQDPLLLTI